MYLLLKKIFRRAKNKILENYFVYKCPNCHHSLRITDNEHCYSIHCPKCGDLMIRS